MKVVILAGGRGSRLSEETLVKPKPMIEVGDVPILWHIMKIYSYYGFNDFIICLGYKGEIIKDYFCNYYTRMSDITVDLKKNSYVVHENQIEPWKVTLADTGLQTNSAGRIMRIQKYVKEEPFMMTYGDGVADINIRKLVEFHQKNGKTATITVAKPAGRYGALHINDENHQVEYFQEKSSSELAFVNAGFAVFNPEIFQYLDDEMQQLEKEPFEGLVENRQLVAYKHMGFWHSMDTMKDKIELNDFWETGNAPWKLW